MKVIIAGGRDYVLGTKEFAFLDEMRWEIPITEVVSGCATGADAGGEEWARVHDIPVMPFVPHWKKYGKAAGPIRNAQMAEYADALIAFPGGSGTADMVEKANAWGIEVIHFIPGITQ